MEGDECGNIEMETTDDLIPLMREMTADNEKQPVTHRKCDPLDTVSHTSHCVIHFTLVTRCPTTGKYFHF